MQHFGCIGFYLDRLHSLYAFFIPIFFSIVFVVTFIMNVGYIVEERQNKTKVERNNCLLIIFQVVCRASLSIFQPAMFSLEPISEKSIFLGVSTHLWSSYMGQQLGLGHSIHDHLHYPYRSGHRIEHGSHA